MRIGVLTARYPQASGKGDQSRSMTFVRHLAATHEVRVVTAGRPADAGAADALERLADVRLLPGSAVLRVVAAATTAARGRPAQLGWMMPAPAWHRVPHLLVDCDAVLAVTIRVMRDELPRPVVLDHVDALSLNMARRARSGDRRAARMAARFESRALRRWEAQVAQWVTAQVATSEEDAAHLPAPRPAVIPVGLDGTAWAEPEDHERPIDVVFSGNMAYPPNSDAARWIARELAPELRRQRPGVRITVVGRGASRLGLQGVEVASDVPDVLEYLRSAKVAVAPLRGGTGSPYKVLEAAASGAAIVAEPWVAERFRVPVRTAERPADYARHVLELLSDPGERARSAARAATAVAEHGAAEGAARVEALLVAAAGSRPK